MDEKFVLRTGLLLALGQAGPGTDPPDPPPDDPPPGGGGGQGGDG